MAASFEGTPWVLAFGEGMNIPEGVAPSATFEGGVVTGSTGCNRFTGTYIVDGGRFEIGRVASTLMACAPPLDALEQAYLAALDLVGAWASDGDALVLSDSDGNNLLRYEEATPVGEWETTGFLSEDAFRSIVGAARITATFAKDGRLGGSAGCNTYRASYTTGRGAIEIGMPASTRKHCPEPAGVMEQEAAYLALLPRAARFALSGRTLELLNADGMRLVSYIRVANP